MSQRTVVLHAFCSAKGGVGKSTLAVGSAKLLAAQGKCPIVVDADLTGTSLADGLHLLAPKMALKGDGALDLDAAPSGKVLSPSETRSLRSRRKVKNDRLRPLPPPYLNDALTYRNDDEMRECRVDAMLWRHERDDGVLYLPSSPLRPDIEVALGWLYRAGEPFSWLRRFSWILDELMKLRSDVSDIVIDLPPGLFGFTHETLVLLSYLSRREPFPEGFPAWHEGAINFRVNPFLVMTPDRSDLVSALEHFALHAARLPELRPLVNRNTEGIGATRAAVRYAFEGPLRVIGLEEQLVSVDEARATLGRIFLDQDLKLTDEVTRVLVEPLRLNGIAADGRLASSEAKGGPE